MKWTIERYVLREVVQTWVGVTGVLVAILLANQLSRVLGQAADNQYGRQVVFDLIALGAYAKGSDRELDEAIARMPKIESFLRQDPAERVPFDEAVTALQHAIR